VLACAALPLEQPCPAAGPRGRGLAPGL